MEPSSGAAVIFLIFAGRIVPVMGSIVGLRFEEP